MEWEGWGRGTKREIGKGREEEVRTEEEWGKEGKNGEGDGRGRRGRLRGGMGGKKKKEALDKDERLRRRTMGKEGELEGKEV